MHITDFTSEEIAGALAKEEKERRVLAGKQERLASSLTRLHRKQAAFTKEEKDRERRCDLFRIAQALQTSLPEEVWTLRVMLGEKRIKARETDSRRESAELRAQITELEKQLITKCPHPLVVNADGYKGYSSADDDDRSEPGERFCAICDLHEYEYARWSNTPAGFIQLVETSNRVWGSCRREMIGDNRKEILAIQDYRTLLTHFTPQRALELLEQLRNAPTK